MRELLKMERYQLSHNFLYGGGGAGIFLIGFFTAETYVPEVMGTAGGAAASLADIFNGMVYDSTFLLILMSGMLALLLGQEFSCRIRAAVKPDNTASVRLLKKLGIPYYFVTEGSKI